MAFEHNEGKGSIFHERNKENPRAPDLKGTAKLNGEKVYISAWQSDRFDGFTLSFETQAQRTERMGGATVPASSARARLETSMMTSRSDGGHYDDRGNWQRTKFCFVSCGDRCTCTPPLGQYYSAAHDKSKEKPDEHPPVA
jgi:hypothetical protein